jgi:hypothetical protein
MIDGFQLGFANRTLGYRLPGTWGLPGIGGQLERIPHDFERS